MIYKENLYLNIIKLKKYTTKFIFRENIKMYLIKFIYKEIEKSIWSTLYTKKIIYKEIYIYFSNIFILYNVCGYEK